MVIGERIKELREMQGLSQGDIEKRTGLLRCYTSRVENGHTVPSLETIEKIARALDLPLYRVFYDGEKPPENNALGRDGRRKDSFGKNGKEARYLHGLIRLLGKMNQDNRNLLMHAARLMAKNS